MPLPNLDKMLVMGALEQGQEAQVRVLQIMVARVLGLMVMV